MAAFFYSLTDQQRHSKEAGSGGKYIMTSGIYPVTINFISVVTNDSNARSLNFNVSYEGTDNTL